MLSDRSSDVIRGHSEVTVRSQQVTSDPPTAVSVLCVLFINEFIIDLFVLINNK